MELFFMPCLGILYVVPWYCSLWNLWLVLHILLLSSVLLITTFQAFLDSLFSLYLCKTWNAGCAIAEIWKTQVQWGSWAKHHIVRVAGFQMFNKVFMQSLRSKGGNLMVQWGLAIHWRLGKKAPLSEHMFSPVLFDVGNECPVLIHKNPHSWPSFVWFSHLV